MRAVSRGKQRLRADTMRTQCKAIGLMSRQSALQKMSRKNNRDIFSFFSASNLAKRQCETAANNAECISDWNFWSSLLKCSCKFELSESTVVASMAVFSIGLALSFL